MQGEKQLFAGFLGEYCLSGRGGLFKQIKEYGYHRRIAENERTTDGKKRE